MRILPIFLLSLFLTTEAISQAGLSITPKRVVFEGNQQTKEVYLLNRSGETQHYNISFIEYKMEEDGSFTKIEQDEAEEGHYMASDHVRFFPRRLSLGPGESQTVRLQLRLPRDIDDKELRSHLAFRNVPRETPLGYADGDDEEEGFSIQLRAIYGLSIPVIVRRGDLQADVSLGPLSLYENDEGEEMVEVHLNRSGNKSAYGNINVFHESEQGERVQVGVVRGIGIYTPLDRRIYNVRLRNTENIDLNSGKLIVRYEYNEDRQARESQIAEEELVIN